MYKYHKLLLSGLLLVVMSAFAWKADPIRDLLDRLSQALTTYRVNLNPEKMYLHFDKPQYVSGEIAWFKAYLVDASGREAPNGDQVVHIDLLDREGRAIQQLKMKASNGLLDGHLLLPDSLQTGTYQVVAYTNWMRNFEGNQFFRKNISVVHPDSDLATASVEHTAETEAVADLQFFPEGGDWIVGLPAEMAFKAINSRGEGVAAEGRVLNSRNEEVARFESLHAGMGSLQLQPKAGESYVAELASQDGKPRRFPLPEPRQSGVSLSVDEYSDPSVMAVNVRSTETVSEELLLTIIGKDELIYSQRLPADEDMQALSIDKSALPLGINRVTLARANGEMLAERLVFSHPDRQLNIDIQMNEPEYLKREEVRVDIRTTDAAGEPVAAHLSLAVSDEELVPDDHEERNIFSHLLLNSELKGYVEKPDYYFEDVDETKKAALRLVMMTHGWRRFAWEDLTDQKRPSFAYQRKTSLSLDGKLLNEKDEPVKGGEVILYVKDQHESFVVSETNEEGRFSFEGFDFNDSVEVVIQGATAKGKRNVKVVMDESGFVPELEESYPRPTGPLLASREQFITRAANQAAVEDAYRPGLREMLLKEIIVQERAEQIVEPFTLLTRPDVVINADDLPTAPSGNILQSLQGRVAGLRVYRNGFNDYRAVIRGSGSPLYLIDGMPVDASAMNMINQFDIDRIEVVKGPGAAAYGGRGGGGVIALFTKRGGVEYEEATPGDNIIVYRAGGFQQIREFYTPAYTAEGKTERPDYRTSLHWEPNIRTDKQGQASLRFFTADRSTAYRVVVNGITADGLPGGMSSSFEVVSPEEVSP